MTRARVGLLAAGLLFALAPRPASARVRSADPGQAMAALAAARDGDTIRLAAGVHAGPLVVNRAITLRGEPGAVVDGGGRGSVLVVLAPDVRVEDLRLRGSGRSVMDIDCALRLTGASGAIVRRLEVERSLYGIVLERSNGVAIEHCDLRGQARPASAELDHMAAGDGNGIHVWYSAGVRLARNEVHGFTDAIYLSFAHGAALHSNDVHDNTRYGFHTMYCQDGVLEGNRFARNAAGIAIMFSNHLRIAHNAFVRNRGARTYGVLLRDCSGGAFEDNVIAQNTIGVFMDNSNRNRFAGNRVEDNGWGVILYASCADNVFAGTDFLHNDHPVALDMRRTRNHFDDGTRGNHWSEAAAYDLDGDGVGDAPHSPVSTFAFMSKQYPDLTLLARSPAVAALSVAERMFPVLRPSDCVDRFPSVAPVTRAIGAGSGREPTRPARSWAAVTGFTAMAALGAFGCFARSRA